MKINILEYFSLAIILAVTCFSFQSCQKGLDNIEEEEKIELQNPSTNTRNEDCIIELCWLDFAGHFECLKEIEFTFTDGSTQTLFIFNLPVEAGYHSIRNSILTFLDNNGINFTSEIYHPLGEEYDCYKGNNVLPGFYFQSDQLEQITFIGGDCDGPADTSVSTTDENCGPCIMNVCWSEYNGHFKCLHNITLIMSDGSVESFNVPPLVTSIHYTNLQPILEGILSQLNLDFEITNTHPYGDENGCTDNYPDTPNFYIIIEGVESIIFSGSACGNPNVLTSEYIIECE